MRKIRAFAKRHLPMMITCGEADAFIVDFIDNELPFVQRLTFKMHIELCPPCKLFLARYRDTLRRTKSAFRDADAPASEELPEALVQAILKARSKGPR